MTDLLPDDIAIIVLGPGGAALGRRLRTALPGARLHGPRAHPGDRPDNWDEVYDRASLHITRLFEAGQPIIGLCASGILIRSVAPLLAAKREEPPVVAVAEDGSVAVPLIGGHRGANALARAVAELTGGNAAITTAGDLRLGLALDEPPPGWRIANPEKVKPLAAALLRGDPVALTEEVAGAEWLRVGTIRWTEGSKERVVVTDHEVGPDADALVFHPPILALGIGCERGCSTEEISDLARSALAEAGLARGAVAAIVSIELKLGEPGIHALAAELGVPARFFVAQRLLAEKPRLSARSEAVFRATGAGGVAEGGAIADVGRTGCWSCQSVNPGMRPARSRGRPSRSPPTRSGDRGAARHHRHRPGDPPGARRGDAALARASDVVGYGLYLDLLGRAIDGKNAACERDRRRRGGEVRHALDLAADGRSWRSFLGRCRYLWAGAPRLRASRPCGQTGMAERRTFRLPGLSALQAAASRAGAPLGHDFCAIRCRTC
jgi:cobalt-precorrin 5A hydrolase/precorrin-3B C17-methyltransferase